MLHSDPRSFLDKLVGLCFSLLLAAVALYEAVRLIERVWVVLVVITSAVLVLTGAITLLLIHHRSW